MSRHGTDRHERTSVAYQRQLTYRPGPLKLCGDCDGHGSWEDELLELHDCDSCGGLGVLNP